MNKITPEQRQILFAERSKLFMAQEEALKHAAYLPLTEEELKAYVERRNRIQYITAILAESQAA